MCVFLKRIIVKEGYVLPLKMIMELLTLRSVALSLLDLSWITRVQVNQAAILRRAEQIQARRSVKEEWQVQALLSILSPPTPHGAGLFPQGHSIEFRSRCI